MLDYHYLGTVYVSKAAWPHLKAADHGCIVNTTSEAVAGFIPKNEDYAGAKGAVLSFTKALALNGRRSDVRVNAVAPRGHTRMSSPEVISHVFDRPPVDFSNEYQRQMRPEHVSPAVAFLAHDSCPLTGEVIVCGGLLARRLAFVQTKGLEFVETVTPEDLREGLDMLMDPTDCEIIDIVQWS
jgi:hypothetical protein